MTDQELLQDAAKSAGINVRQGVGLRPGVLVFGETGAVWNPLTDDGDALRLAVKLSLVLNMSEFSTRAWRLMPGSVERAADNDGDPYATTRRAIVRAAAEIGRNMK